MLLVRRIINPLLINQPVQDSLRRSLHDQNMTGGIVLPFMDRELDDRGAEEEEDRVRTRHDNPTRVCFSKKKARDRRAP